ncbi:TIGR01777 family oxidoreductase [Hymenobacter sp. BT559]|uniref:TIGR01777 family oxidoreductase n=1 Tax=Hymenobacter sp. BT559 TaxID=2795729 RepID=UPI0018EBCBC2|nr:TIGR01777 family oxidoreductase [Hymenobacter sp. BT559]MBJ6142638.1 TIGR01777 family oxidoreductase [Hymenobacter sp. BT559]
MKILITGGTGMIGQRLAELLIDAGNDVALLTREPGKSSHYRLFGWDPAAGTIDPAALPFADCVVNLAGSNVAEGKWTASRKQEILRSRLDGLELLHRELAKPGHHVRTLLSASAIGIYGDRGDELLYENSPTAAPADDFLADVVLQWEAAACAIGALGPRVVLPRIGIVLSPEGGALAPIAKTVRFGAGAPLGSGRQYMSWIHLDDMCRLLAQMMHDELWQGEYNAVAPNPVTNQEFTETLAQVMHRPLVLPKVPAFGLKLAMGEMSEIVLGSQRVSADKVLSQGFQFEYTHLKAALESFYE